MLTGVSTGAFIMTKEFKFHTGSMLTIQLQFPQLELKEFKFHTGSMLTLLS